MSRIRDLTAVARLPGAGLALALAMTGCAAPQVPLDAAAAQAPSETLADCCTGTGDYPTWAIELADRNVEFMRAVGLIQLRRGRSRPSPRPAR
ncbi:MAG: hypothetical protein R3D80_11190 [Paracoccaceae bacterium]